MTDLTTEVGSAQSAGPPRPARPRRRRFNLVGTLVIVGVLAVWEAAVQAGLLTFESTPAPSAIAVGFWEMLGEGGPLLSALWHTLWVLLAAWAVGLVLGAPLGIALGSAPTAWRWTMASIDMLRAIPVIMLIPVGFLIFGISVETELILAAGGALWPILVNATGGVRAVHPRLRDVAAQEELSRFQVLSKIVLPASLPSILVGARVALTLSLVITVIVEMLGNPKGLGNALVFARDSFRPDQMWAYLLLMGVVGIALNGLMVLATRILQRGYPRSTGGDGQ
jgi:ABC-type nitrate/sulfonate/bicarbonate transport system permease component